MIVEYAHRLAADFIVVGQLVGNRSDTGLLDAGHVVIPQINTFIGVFPIRDPAEISWINIRGDAILETVQLIRADEVHFTRQASAISHQAQVMSEGRHGRRHIGGIVITAAGRNILTGHEGITRRGTQRTRTVGGIEQHAFACQPINIWTFNIAIVITAERERAELIGHDYEYVLHEWQSSRRLTGGSCRRISRPRKRWYRGLRCTRD